MVVCKYFLQGICRFGEKCNYEHPNQSPNPYRYVASNANTQTNNFSKLQQSSNDNEAFLNLIKTDLLSLKNSSQWKLTCYSPFSNKYEPILNDEFSPEEIRFGFYQAAKQNGTREFIQEFNRKNLAAMQKVDQLINPNADTRNYLINLNDEIKKKELDASQSNSQQPKPTNLFESLIQKQQVDTQQKPNLFTNLMQNTSKPNLFSQTATTNTFFGQQTKQLDLTQQQQQQPTKNTFFDTFKMNSQNQQTSQSPFGTHITTVPVFNTTQFKTPIDSVFNVTPQPVMPQIASPSFISPTPQIKAFDSIQLQPTNFGQLIQNKPMQTPQLGQTTHVNVTSTYYSSLNELNENDIKEYKSDKFTLGKIPILPPAKEFC